MNKLPFQRPSRSSVVIWSIIILLLIMVALSIVLRRAPAEPVVVEEKAYPVSVATVLLELITDDIEMPGRIEAMVQARLAVEKPGRITEILVDEGDAVTNGQVLLRINDELWKAHLDRAEIEWREAQRDYHRWTELRRSGAVSTSDLDLARARLDQADVNVNEAREHLAQCLVLSPSDGVINARFVERGEHVPEGGAVFELVVTDPVKVTVDLPEREVGAVSVGAPLRFSISLLGPQVYTGAVSFIASAASPLNNSFRAEAQIPNPDGVFKPGMIAQVGLQRGQPREVMAVPLASVIPRKGEHFVFVAREDRAIRRLVRIDRILGSQAILARGLEPGEVLILEGHRGLVDGALITRVEGTMSGLRGD